MAEDIETELAGWLRSRAVLATLLDKDKAGIPRIHPRRLPQAAGTSPKAIVFHVISDVSENYLGGGVDVSHAIVQFDCYGPNPAYSTQIRKLLNKELVDHFRGLIGSMAARGIIHEGNRNDTDEPEDASDAARFISHSEFRISYKLT